jgi:DNA-binding transcriptional LysR family regulator
MNKLDAMRCFVRVVQTGSFSEVARESETSQATISKRVAELEKHLNARLLVRSSRDHRMTEAGQIYYDRCLSILDDVEQAEEEVGTLTSTPRGKIRITAPVDFARMNLSQHISEFLCRYSEIHIELILDDRMVGFISDDIDLAIRIGKLEDSSLVATSIGSSSLIVVTSPQYVSKHGEPQDIRQLQHHNCLVFSYADNLNTWGFIHDDRDISVPVSGNFQCNNGDTIIKLLLADMGIAMLPAWLVAPYIEDGSLIQILNSYSMPLPVYIVYQQRKLVPLKIRSFIDYLRIQLVDIK